MATKNTKTTKVTTPKEVVNETKKTKIYSPNDLITCRSITQGGLIMPGKSGIVYEWSGYGDTTGVEYQDLYAWKSSRSKIIYEPYMIVEDEDILNDTRWKDVKKQYEDMYDAEDLGEVLSFSPTQFKSVLKQAPTGLKKAIAVEVATRLENGSFDSIQKLKIVDEICGTELSKLQ